MERSSTPGVAAGGGGVDVTVALGAVLLKFNTPPSSTSPTLPPPDDREGPGLAEVLLTLAPSRDREEEEEPLPSRRRRFRDDDDADNLDAPWDARDLRLKALPLRCQGSLPSRVKGR